MQEPTRNDLLAVVKMLRQHDGLDIARASRDRAKKAMEDFLSTNEEYQKLSKEHERCYSYYCRMVAEHRNECNKLEQLVRLQGPTPEVIKAVAKLVRKKTPRY